jgi:glycosyltransferase involved in cell wall biosynthesis
MKIVHVLPNSKIGGVQSFVADLSRMQKKDKHDVSVVFKNLADHPADRFSDINVVDYNVFLKNFSRNVYKNSIIHTHGHVVTVIGFLSIMFRAKKIVHTVHNTPTYESGRYRRFLHRLLYVSNLVTPVSISMRLLDEFNALYKLNCQNYVLNGVSTDRPLGMVEQTLSWNKSKMDLLFVGRLDYQKNLQLLLNSLKEISHELPWHLHVVGKDYGVYDTEIYKQMLIDRQISYYGELKNIRGFLTDADVLVQSSLFEGLPILLLEAKLNSLLVLSTDVGGCSEILGVNDYLCAVDVGEMSDALTRIIRSYVLHGKIKSSSNIDISIDRCSEGYMKIYGA